MIEMYYISICFEFEFVSVTKLGILVEPLDAERTMRSNLRKMEDRPDCNKMKFPENYTAFYDFVSIWLGATIFGM